MAEKEEKKPSRSERMYGKSPRIEAEAGKGGGAQTQEKAPEAEARRTAGSPPRAPAPKERDVPASHAAGAGEANEGEARDAAMSMTDVHGREIKDMHHRHERERRDMHSRHEQEHKEMRTRHAAELGEEAPVSEGDAGEEK